MTSSAAWKSVEVTGDVPLPRIGHAAVGVGDSVYVVGGKATCAGDPRRAAIRDVLSRRERREAARDGIDVYWLRMGASPAVWERLRSEDSDPTSAGPSQRWGFSLTFIDCGSDAALDVGEPSLFLFFGGFDSESTYRDTWILQLYRGNKQWQAVQNANATAPSHRSYHSAVWAAKTSTLVLFGGQVCRQGSYSYLDDLVSFDLVTTQWRHTHDTGPRPCARAQHSACSLVLDNQARPDGGDEFMVVVGGLDEQHFFTDIHLLNLRTYEWVALEVRGEVPRSLAPSADLAIESIPFLVKPVRGQCLRLPSSAALYVQPGIKHAAQMTIEEYHHQMSMELRTVEFSLGADSKADEASAVVATWRQLDVSGSTYGKACCSCVLAGGALCVFGGENPLHSTSPDPIWDPVSEFSDQGKILSSEGFSPVLTASLKQRMPAASKRVLLLGCMDTGCDLSSLGIALIRHIVDLHDMGAVT